MGSMDESPDFLSPIDEDIIAGVAENVDDRTIRTRKSVSDLLEAHQRSIYDKVIESRYIDLRHKIKDHSFCENENTCYFVVPPSIWALERTYTDFTTQELKIIATVHTRQTRRRATQNDDERAVRLLEDRLGFIVYKPEFMQRAYQLHQRTLLSEREAEVQALVEKGHPSSTIAEILGISTGAVDSIRYNRIASKLGAARETVELLDGE